MSKIVTVPFGWLLAQLYNITNNYGVAMVLFAVAVQLVLLPITAKSKKSMMKMSRLSPLMQELQRKYADDPQRQQQAVSELYKSEGVSMGGGCLWSLVPLLILFPLFTVIREPITYILMESQENADAIVKAVKDAAPELFKSASAYNQVIAAGAIRDYAAEIQAAVPGISAQTLQGINFEFLGVNVGAIPEWKFWLWDAWSWANIGAFLIPVLSAGSQVLTTVISQKMNNSVITNEKGIHDEEMAKNSQQNKSMKTMLYIMPVMSLIIGFTVSAGLSLYWLVGGVVRTVEDAILTNKYRKLYDAEDAERLKRHLEEERIEAEKERIRAERRAANPDGITENTSKKKLQKKQRSQEQAAKAAAAKEYAAKKGIVFEEEDEEECMSGIPERPFCKGRNYEPNRYSTSTEE